MGTTSVTSPGLEGRYPPAEMAKRLQEANPHLRFTNTHERGYMILTVTPDEVQGEWLYVDTIENREFTERSGAIVSVKASNAVGTLPLEVLHS